jgi:dTDP-4-amino-4,6-dideoxygalactose transaminase
MIAMIQFVDLLAQYGGIRTEVEDAVLKVLRGGQYIMGPEVASLEAELAQFAGARHSVSCASGTDALMIALMAKGVGPGDAVFTTPFTFMASAEVIALVGATPVFVDVDPVTFNMDPAALARAIEALKTGNPDLHPLPACAADAAPLIPRGIIAVDLFGLPADYVRINRIAAENGLFVIEDAAQSFGGTLGNRRAGALAEIACTSFFPAKPLGCYGDGGAIFTDDDGLDALFRSLRVHGQGSDKYENVRIGITGRLDTVQAAILLVKLRVFEKELEQRQAVAEAYTSRIRTARIELVTPQIPEGYTSAWAQYSVLARNEQARDTSRQRLADAGIPTAVYYPKPLHLQKAFGGLEYRTGDMPVSEDLGSRIFSLPMHPYLPESQIETIVKVLSGQAA